MIRNGVAMSTSKQYASGQITYLSFCQLLQLTPIPASEVVLLRFVAAHAESHSGYTLQNYLSAVRFLHVANGYANPMKGYERLRLVIRALKKRSGAKRRRSPVTLHMLSGIRSNLQMTVLNDALFWAMISCAFFGSLRLSEFTTSGSFDPNYDLALQDLSFSSDLSAASLQTDPFRLGVAVLIGATKNYLRPVSTMLSYLTLHGTAPGPLFKFKNGRAASYSWFSRQFKKAISDIEYRGTLHLTPVA